MGDLFVALSLSLIGGQGFNAFYDYLSLLYCALLVDTTPQTKVFLSVYFHPIPFLQFLSLVDGFQPPK